MQPLAKSHAGQALVRRQHHDRMIWAEAISVLASGMALAGNFGTGAVTAHDLAAGLQGAIVKDEEKDKVVWQEYLSNVLKKRGAEWRPLFTACAEHNS